MNVVLCWQQNKIYIDTSYTILEKHHSIVAYVVNSLQNLEVFDNI